MFFFFITGVFCLGACWDCPNRPFTKNRGWISIHFDGHRLLLKVGGSFSTADKAAPDDVRSVIYRHGCPKRILFDQGREFINQVCVISIYHLFIYFFNSFY